MENYADDLLNRTPENEYVKMWADLLQHQKLTSEPISEESLLLFRLGKEWLGITTKVLSQVLESRPIHTVPSIRSPILLGVVNIGGQLRLCIALHKLLEIAGEVDYKAQPRVTLLVKKQNRMLAIKRGIETWVFPVNEVHGVVSCNFDTFSNVPVNLSKASVNYLKGMWQWEGNPVTVLDEELLFESLRRTVP